MITAPGSLGLRGRQGCPDALAPLGLGRGLAFGVDVAALRLAVVKGAHR